ncbi:MAG TPA: hypothetical protein VG735_02685 [Caulobacterales bacterium]|jgi:hypothetical protein|nr:hypothetical protein [Caulobacterales bacterium]
MTVSPEVQATFDYLFGLAAKALHDNRSFAPFGSAVARDGGRTHTTTDLQTLTSQPTDHLAAVLAVLHDHALGGARTAGVVFDTIAPPGAAGGPNAVCVHAETVLGEAVQIFVPYRRDRADEPVFAEPVLQDVPKRIFVA